MAEAGLGAATLVIRHGICGPAAQPDAIAAEANSGATAGLARGRDARCRRELETRARVPRGGRVPVA